MTELSGEMVQAVSGGSGRRYYTITVSTPNGDILIDATDPSDFSWLEPGS